MTRFHVANKDPLKSISNLQLDVGAIATWCKNNGIQANTDKTKVMIFGSQKVIDSVPPFEVRMNGVPLQLVSSYKYLGVSLDAQLNYNLHINNIIASAFRKLQQFQRMRSFLSTKAALFVYKSMLLPILEYGDILLNAASAQNRKTLQTLQNKGLRCALNKGIETSRACLHAEAGLLRLDFRRGQHLFYSYSAGCN